MAGSSLPARDEASLWTRPLKLFRLIIGGTIYSRKHLKAETLRLPGICSRPLSTKILLTVWVILSTEHSKWLRHDSDKLFQRVEIQESQKQDCTRDAENWYMNTRIIYVN